MCGPLAIRAIGIRPPQDLFRTTMAYGGYAWYRHHWSETLRSTVAFGFIWWGGLGSYCPVVFLARK